MKRIGVTSRVDFLADRNERRDAVDQALITLLGQLGFSPIILANTVSDPNAYIASLSLEGLVLSGGNDLSSLPEGKNQAPERDRLETSAIEYCSHAGLPVFGVCRGLQMINHYFGGTISVIEGHAGCRHTVQKTKEGPNAWDKTFDVNSYHTFCVRADELASDLTPWATATDGSIEAFGHNKLPIAAIMWHPEREESFSQTDCSLVAAILGGENS